MENPTRDNYDENRYYYDMESDTLTDKITGIIYTGDGKCIYKGKD